ncbi:hypothetical protein [Nocardia coubleae]|uniref:Uncharacterized protein n=1 Tax=Nocardia coubleae TaxID=356147 RepID=A0A846W267_9NOCA|nr:hypothetical protein [Nocardia coubleae]NKX86846.1 hypothetical protein [Nocardia coubleae]
MVGYREFLWWVREDLENYHAPGAASLRVATDDRRIMLNYVLNQDEEARHVTVLGPEFRGVTQHGPAFRFRCPMFGLPDEIRPHTWPNSSRGAPILDHSQSPQTGKDMPSRLHGPDDSVIGIIGYSLDSTFAQ